MTLINRGRWEGPGAVYFDILLDLFAHSAICLRRPVRATLLSQSRVIYNAGCLPRLSFIFRIIRLSESWFLFDNCARETFILTRGKYCRKSEKSCEICERKTRGK